MKRIFAAAMALALVFALLPALAFAEGTNNTWAPANTAELLTAITAINTAADPVTPTEYTINLDSSATYSITKALSISYNANKKIIINGSGAILDGTGMSTHNSATNSGVTTCAQDLVINNLTIQNMGGHGVNNHVVASNPKRSTVTLNSVSIKNCWKAAVAFHGTIYANNLTTIDNNQDSNGVNDWGTFNGGDQNGIAPELFIRGGSFNDLGTVGKVPDGTPVTAKLDDNNSSELNQGLGYTVKFTDNAVPESFSVVITVKDIPEDEPSISGYGFENGELNYLDPVKLESTQAIAAGTAQGATDEEIEAANALLQKVTPVVLQGGANNDDAPIINSEEFHGNTSSIVTMGVDPTFTITIPASVDFGTLEHKSATAVKPFNVSISNAYLAKDTQVTVTVKEIVGMKTAGVETPIAYQLFADGVGEVTTNNVFATFLSGSATGTQDGTVTCEQSQIVYAGSYSGTMTFVIDYREATTP